MALDLRHVTVYEARTDARSGEIVQTLVSARYAMRLRGGTASFPVFLQDGHIYAEGGEVLRDPPGWVAEEMAKCRPEALQACGFGPPLDRTAPMPVSVTSPGIPAGFWQCPDCQDILQERKRDMHSDDCYPIYDDAPSPAAMSPTFSSVQTSMRPENGKAESLPQERSSRAKIPCLHCGEIFVEAYMGRHVRKCRAAIHSRTPG